jgi:hypothetical protein
MFPPLFMAAMLAASAAAATDWQPPVTRTMVEREFLRFDPEHRSLKKDRIERLKLLQQQLIDLHLAGSSMHCSTQIENETRWRLHSTTEWSRIDRYLWLLQTSMLDSEQDFALEQTPEDGSWGLCYDQWFKKLDPTIDALNRYATLEFMPTYPMRFLNRIASADALIAQLAELRLSDIAAEGIDNRQPLGGLMSFAAEIAFKPGVRELVNRDPAPLHIDEGYLAEFTRFLDDWQDPETGYWGPWYLIDGKLLKATDLSFTYHIVAYRDGDVRHWDKILTTTLALKEHEYPFGWRFRGRNTNHNAYDVVRILKLGWDHFDEAQRVLAAREIEALLHWTLDETLSEDGRFLPDPEFDGKVSATYYYGVSMLTKAGYCKASGPPFWSVSPFPEARERCCKIAERVVELDRGDRTAMAARQRLEGALPDCPAFSDALAALSGPAKADPESADDSPAN